MLLENNNFMIQLFSFYLAFDISGAIKLPIQIQKI